MFDRELIGKWRYAVTKKLRKRINKAATKLMCLKIDPESEEELANHYCGTKVLQEDCPFFCNSNRPDHCGVCLAPNNDKLWHETKKEQKQFISPTYEKRNNMVVGCYISIFCQRGYAAYNRLLRWRHKYERTRTFEMAIQRNIQT